MSGFRSTIQVVEERLEQGKRGENWRNNKFQVNIRDAIQPYEQAMRLAPSAPLLRISLSQVYLETNDPSLNKRALAYLNEAALTEGKESTVWHFLAVAYGRDNQIGMAALSLAEEGLASGKKLDAIQQANRARQLLPPDFRQQTRYHLPH